MKKIFIILFLSAGILGKVNSQKINVDSLKLLLKNAKQASYVELLLKISKAYSISELDSSDYYATQGEKYAKELKNDSLIAYSILRKGIVAEYRGEYEQAEALYLKAYEISAHGKYERYSFTSAFCLGFLYNTIGKYSSSIEYYKIAAEKAELLKDTLQWSNMYNSLGIVYDYMGNSDKALDYYFKSKTLCEQKLDTLGIASSLNNIGTVYSGINKFDEALKLYELASKYYLIANDSSGMATAINNIGDIYLQMKEYEKARDLFLQVNSISEQISDSSLLALSYRNLAESYYFLEQYKPAVYYHELAIDLYKKFDSHYDICSSYIFNAKLFAAMKEYNIAHKYADSAYNIGVQTNSFLMIRDAAEIYSEILEFKGDTNAALKFYKIFKQANDSIHTSESKQKFAELQTIYEIEQKEIQLTKLESDLEVQRSLVDKEKTIRHVMIFIGILGVILIITLISLISVIYNRYKLRTKTNNLLENKNLELEKANNKLRETEINLRELNATKDKFFTIIAHDLKSPFTSLLGFSEFLTENFNELSQDELHEYIGLIYTSADNLSKLLENLLSWARTQTKGVPYNPQNINLKEVIENNIQLLLIYSVKKRIKIHSNIQEDIFGYFDIDMIRTVLRNLIYNAIKFTEINGSITINCADIGKFYQISVEDNGIGITDENLKKLFELTGHITTRGTSDEQGTGLGLILCKEFVEKNSGSIRVESEIGKGSKFIFTIPKANNSI